jgi:hypothetical protein
MATYYKKPIETPEDNKKEVEKEYSIIMTNESTEIPERYIKAAAQVEALRRLCEITEKESEFPTLETKVIRAVIGA